MLRYFNALVFVFALILSTASEAKMVWYSGNTAYTSAQEACQANMQTAYAGWTVSATVSNVTSTSAYCGGHVHANDGRDYSDFDITQGTWVLSSEGSCDTGQTYNNTNGSCTTPKPADGSKCDDQTGARGDVPMIYSAANDKCILMSDADTPAFCHYAASLNGSPSYYQVPGTVGSAGELVAPPLFIAEATECQMATVTSSNCTLKVGGGSTCEVTATYTGEANTSPGVKDAAKDLKLMPTIDIKPTTEVTDTPCATTGNCTSETLSETSGNQSCGTVNGAMTCVVTPPSSNGIMTHTSTTSKVNADDSVTATTVDDKTSTKCTTVKTCTTTNSTTTTSTTTTKSGSTSTTSTCTGTCSTSGTGGTGTGTGDEDGGTASASDDCKVPPSCSGDPFSCAILRQEFLDSCAERALPTAKEKSDMDALIKVQTDGLDANQKDLDDKVSGLLSGFQSAGGGSSGGRCFEDKSFAIPGGGSITLPFSLACPYLEWFRYAILAVAYLISLRIVTKDL